MPFDSIYHMYHKFMTTDELRHGEVAAAMCDYAKDMNMSPSDVLSAARYHFENLK